MYTVLVTGIPRSGSTWLFNSARLLLGRKYPRMQCVWVENYTPTEDVDALLVKIHETDERWRGAADCQLCSRRDLRDIAASTASMGWAKCDAEMIAAASNARKMHEFWSPSAAVDIAYERMRSEPVGCLQEIGYALGIKMRDDEVADVVQRVPVRPSEIGNDGYDPITLLHDRHVNDGRPGRWRNQLPSSVAEAIWAENKVWLIANGYEL